MIRTGIGLCCEGPLLLVPPLHFQSGGVAGLTVDLMLFPMDTVKTRLQSRQGFLKAGGFQKIYAGVGPAVAGSIPSGTEQHEAAVTFPFHAAPMFLFHAAPTFPFHVAPMFYSMLLLRFHSMLLLRFHSMLLLRFHSMLLLRFHSMLLLCFHSMLLLFCSGSIFLYLRVGEDMPLPEGAQTCHPSAPHICSVNG